MANDYQQEFETEIEFKKLFARIHYLTSANTKENFELMVTFNPDFQMKIEAYCTVNLYEHTQGHKRSVFGWPWFTDASQEEKFKVWQAVTEE